MGCCATKSLNINEGLKEKLDLLQNSYMRTLTLNRRTIRKTMTPVKCLPNNEIDLDSIITKPNPKSKQEIKKISQILKDHFLFKALEEIHLQLIISNMHPIETPAGTCLFVQGSYGKNFYLISKGSVEIEVNGAKKGTLTTNECFGELALLYDSTRTATVIVVEDSEFLAINRKTFRNAVRSVSNNSYQDNKHFLESLKFFQALTEPQQTEFISWILCMDYIDEQDIISEGDIGNMMFIVKSGQVKVMIRKNTLRILKVGDLFGEICLLFDQERSACVKAIGEVSILALDSEHCLGLIEKTQWYLYKTLVLMAFETDPILRDLNYEQYVEIIPLLEFKSFSADETIKYVSEGYIIVLLKGQVRVKETLFEKLKIFGLESEDTQEDLTGAVPGIVAYIKTSTLTNLLGGKLTDIVKKNEILKILTQVQVFRPLPIEKLEEITKYFTLETLKPHSIIIKENSYVEDFIIVKSGQLSVIKNLDLVRSLGKFSTYGEKSLITEEISEFSIKSLGNCELWKISKYDFARVIDKSILDQMKKMLALREHEIELENLYFVKLINTGSYSNSYLVYHPAHQQFYALKAVLKSTVEGQKMIDSILMEKKVLQEIDHPLITKLIKTFKDEFRLYFLFDYVQGVQFFDLISQVDVFKNAEARFYAAGILMIMQHLHGRSIIYRDLKPDNFMIDKDGYPVLMDFSVAKLTKERTYSLIGTPHYMAPEIIKGTGYTKVSDYWSFGIIVYELLTGRVPFGHSGDDLYAIYKSIISMPVKFPKKSQDIPARPFIEQLLQIDPEKRLHGQSAKRDPWLQGTNWDYYLGKFIKPPLVPSIDPVDISSAALLDDVIYVFFN